MAAKTIISLNKISKSYDKKEILKNITTEFRRHETVGIVGANGTGKTTLLSMMCQTLKPSSGDIKFFLDLAKGSVKYQIGVQFQSGEWPPGISSADMIKFYRGVYPNVPKKRVAELIDIFEIKDFIKQPLTRLSGGQKQRFNAFLAVMHDPEITFFDEVTTGLDIELQYKILTYLKSLAQKKQQTIFIVSHGPEEVEQLTDRIILIHKKQI